MIRSTHSLRIGQVCALVAALWTALAVAAGAQNVKLPAVTRTKLANGIRVVLMEYRRAPTVTLLALFPGGESVEPAGKAGIASLTASLLRKGTETRTAPQIAEQVDFLGASLSAAAGDDLCTVSLSTLARDLDSGLELFADVVRHPTFPAEELERERHLEVSALESLGEDPGAVAARVATEVVFAGHPYGREATITSIKGISQEDVRSYHSRFLQPGGAILVAVGEFKTPEMLARLKARFEDWKPEGGQAAMPLLPPVRPAKPRFVLVDKPDATQTQVRFNRVAFPRISPDYFPAQIADTVLGGGFTSRLTEEIRVNRSLTYGISSRFAAEKLGGAFTVSTFTKVETTRKLIDAVKRVLARAASAGFTHAELAKAKGYLAGLFAIRVQTPEALAGQLAEIAFYGLPDNYLETYLSRLRSVTLEQANRIARTYYSPSGLSLTLVTPAKAIAAQLRGLPEPEVRSVDSVGK